MTLNKDSAKCRPGTADYLLLFEKPGENPVPIETTLTDIEWIKWARPVWYDIKETAVLNTRVVRKDQDERHICPLQLPVIERCVRLWSNPGETILSPFAGIGSEGYMAIKHGRKFLGIELKREYYDVACRNLKAAEEETYGLDQMLIDEILAEVKRAETLHPHWPADPIHGAAIVSEESGEAIRAALRLVYEGGTREALRVELIHTAATALRMLGELDKEQEKTLQDTHEKSRMVP